jgi:twitching motility protein PilJ
MAEMKKMAGAWQLPALMVAALVCFLGAAVVVLSLGRAAPTGATQVRQINELVALSQKIPAQAAIALSGNEAAFDELEKARERYSQLAESLGPQVQGLSASVELLKQSQTILLVREPTLTVTRAAAEVRELLPQLLQAMGNVVSTMGPGVEAMDRTLDRFQMAGLKAQQDLQALALGVDDPIEVVRRAGDGIDFMGQVIADLSGEPSTLGLPRVSGAESETRLKTASGLYGQLRTSVRSALGSADRVQSARQANTALLANANEVYERLENRIGATNESEGLSNYRVPLAGLLIIGSVAAFVLLVMYLRGGKDRSKLELLASKNERNQEAILRLLDELSSLADGDLTVQATVTEDITGAIADSINYAIEALRELVATINVSAMSLDGAAKQTQTAAGQLAKASVAQSKQIGQASESVVAMAGSTEEVSGNAERSADVARHSVDVANKGSQAVRRTIDGMNAIRETIQETSKRIKRLGESSQEIGNIVELINDIAEQTNILALNASIQASMAGEAGRGFAVVADEVQRLAERAANATKQIEVLVRTIQADTNEAVVSMERSTTDVVGGALLAENAGAALQEIEQVSNQIASLVQNISSSSRQQAGAAQDISKNMQVLREISTQTADNSATTSESVAKLAELSAQLRKSVSGFRLPEQVSSSVAQAKPMPAAAGAVAAANNREPLAESAALDEDAAAPKKVVGVRA